MSPNTAPDEIPAQDSEPAAIAGVRRTGWRAMLAVAVAVLYPFLVYGVLMQRRPWLVLLLACVALLAGCGLLPRGRWRVAGIVSVLLLAAATIPFAVTASLLFLPPIAINAGLAWFFGRTLMPGREALISSFARMDHREFTPQLLAYTRGWTRVWAIFFIVMASVSGALAATGAIEAWTWFTAVGNYLCVVALFAVEFTWRRYRYPRKVEVALLAHIAMMRAAIRARRR